MLVTMDQYYDVLKDLTGVYARYLEARNQTAEAAALDVPQLRYKKLMLKLRRFALAHTHTHVHMHLHPLFS